MWVKQFNETLFIPEILKYLSTYSSVGGRQDILTLLFASLSLCLFLFWNVCFLSDSNDFYSIISIEMFTVFLYQMTPKSNKMTSSVLIISTHAPEKSTEIPIHRPRSKCYGYVYAFFLPLKFRLFILPYRFSIENVIIANGTTMCTLSFSEYFPSEFLVGQSTIWHILFSFKSRTKFRTFFSCLCFRFSFMFDELIYWR